LPKRWVWVHSFNLRRCLQRGMVLWLMIDVLERICKHFFGSNWRTIMVFACVLFKTRHYADWILSLSSVGPCSVGPNKGSYSLYPSVPLEEVHRVHSPKRCGLNKWLPIGQLLKNIPVFYGTRRFITVLTRSLAKSIESIQSHNIKTNMTK
jgi:hypothetical protein